jgi:hypothetical protein
LVRSADNIQIYKYVTHQVAHTYGKTATFMPKPVYGDNGSGMHTHMSFWKKGKPLFAGSGYADLSDMALHFIGGIIMFVSFFIPGGAAQGGWTSYSPLATTITAKPLVWPRNTMDLAISATEQPMAAAASALVRTGCSNSTTSVRMSASRSNCALRRAVGCWAAFTTPAPPPDPQTDRPRWA